MFYSIYAMVFFFFVIFFSLSSTRQVLMNFYYYLYRARGGVNSYSPFFNGGVRPRERRGGNHSKYYFRKWCLELETLADFCIPNFFKSCVCVFFPPTPGRGKIFIFTGS